MQVIASLHISLQKYFIAVYKQVTYTFNFIILPQTIDLFHFHNISILPNINKVDKLLKWKCFCLPRQKQQFDRKKKTYSNTHQLFHLSVWPTESSSFFPSRTLTSTPPLHTYRSSTRFQTLVGHSVLPIALIKWEAVQLMINHTRYTTSKHLKATIAMGVNLQGRFTVLDQVRLYIHMCIQIYTHTHTPFYFLTLQNNVLSFFVFCANF